LEAVARIASELASAARPLDGNLANLAGISGLLHDFGKYQDCFQQMLRTGQGRCQHAIHGAMLAYFGLEGAARKPGLNTVMAAIAGHHAGLADWSDYSKKLNEQIYRRQAEKIRARASADCKEFESLVSGLSNQQDAFPGATKAKLDLFIRVIFSCLVDADRLNSGGRAPLQDDLRADERLQTLLKHVAELQRDSSEGRVKQMRASVLEDCLDAASSQQKLFSLSVPTGGGKTLAAMAFALQRAALYPERFRRVIVVIPYLSIIEQNAEVYARVFGQDAVLEHHSGSIQKLSKHDEDHFIPTSNKDDQEEMKFQESGLRPETENWDAPLIVTTSVRFFESLFSNRPSDLRRVHNITRSIVILDEVQTLPRRLLGPLLDMMKELAEDWDTNFVFSTATQPAFERKPGPKKDLRWEPGTLTEIICNPALLRETLKRVEISWEIQPEQAVGWPAVAERMMAERQCLAIVNLRDHASQLYAEAMRVAEFEGEDTCGVFHLSTRMCAAHRLRVLDKIRKKLTAGESCHVVSTQLVEAGVDVDFPLVLRALAPLDSIVQAAGRADREGKLTAALGRPGGKVVVFLPEDHKLPPNEYKEATGITEAIAKQELEDGKSVQVDSADAIRLYFERYYGGSGTDLGENLLELRHQLSFASLAQEFEMISSRTRDVFVPDDEEARKALEELRSAGILTQSLRRVLQRHIVGLSPSEFEKARGVIQQVPTIARDEIFVATSYDRQFGLIFNPGPEQFVL
jgi:CRISPR-associated endonuclease/helicase Cas3